MNSSTFSYLNFIHFSQLNLWDFKRYISKVVSSKYPIVKLANFINEENKKIKPFDFPEEKFEILGVNNKTGLFDAYIEDGNKINQLYKIVENGFLAYNPYRINVGSIGLKTKDQKYKYISPAYVVFSCKKDLLPEFLYILFRTDKFNELIRENTTGSVRQTLSFSSMGQIRIPLPTLEKQKKIVDRYNEKIKLAEEQAKEAQNLEQEIESYLFKTLDINIINFNTNTNNNFSFIQTINFKNLKAWSFEKNLKDRFEYTAKYKLYNLDNLCIKITDGTHQTPKYVNKEGIPFLSAKDVTTQKINWENIKYIPTELHSALCKRVRPQLNDILLAKNGTTGVAAIVDKNIEFSIYVSLALLRANNCIIRPNYLLFIINSKIAKMQFNKKLIGIGVPNLHLSEIKTTKIPLPPLEIQDNIICKINEIKAKIEKLNNLAEQNRKLAQEEFEKELFE